MMDLLERYLQAVRVLLPRAEQDDIVQELREDIVSQFEAKQEESGRSLNAREEEEIIRKHGHPVMVAARYGKASYLIGPAVFPFYWLVLRMAALGAVIVRSAIALAELLVSARPSAEIGHVLIAIPSVLVPVFCWVTGAFALFELCSPWLKLRGSANWSPRTLPATGKKPSTVSRPESVAGILFGTIAVFWWQALPGAPYLVFGPAAGIMALGPIWTTLYWPILLVTAASVVQSWWDLAWPELTPLRVTIRLVLRTAGLVLACVILRAGNWVMVAPGSTDAGQSSRAVPVVNQVLFYCFVAGVVLAAVQLAWECVKFYRGSQLSHWPASQSIGKV